MIEVIRSSETSVLTRAIRRHFPEDGVVQVVLLLTLFIARSFFSHWWMRRYVLPKRRFLQGPQGHIPEDAIFQAALLLTLFMARWFFPHWWLRRFLPPKRRLLQEPHGVTSQKTAFFIVSAVKTSSLTQGGTWIKPQSFRLTVRNSLQFKSRLRHRIFRSVSPLNVWFCPNAGQEKFFTLLSLLVII
jgi:hypothetical protein